MVSHALTPTCTCVSIYLLCNHSYGFWFVENKISMISNSLFLETLIHAWSIYYVEMGMGKTHLQWFAAPDREDRCILLRGKACGVPNDPTSCISHVFGNTYTTFQPFPTRTFNFVRHGEETWKVPYHHKRKHHKQYKIICDDVAFWWSWSHILDVSQVIQQNLTDNEDFHLTTSLVVEFSKQF